jgi:hypothetical protein
MAIDLNNVKGIFQYLSAFGEFALRSDGFINKPP